MHEAAEKAGAFFKSGFCCAESVLNALAEAKGIQSEIIPRIATGLCSGMSRTSRTCGALSGAIMGMSLVYGRNTPEDNREYLYNLVQELFERFTKKYRTTLCHELIGCDLNTEEGQKYFVDNNLDPRCQQITSDAAGIAMQLLEEGL
jgi:C_GCAxxG_C_C family probable redox protein